MKWNATRWSKAFSYGAASRLPFHAETTAGKTFVMIDLAFHLALPNLTTWHGRDVAHVPVLYVCLEDVPGFEKRVVAAKLEFGDPGDWFVRLNVPISLNKALGDEGVKTIIEAAGEQCRRCAHRPATSSLIRKFGPSLATTKTRPKTPARYIEQRVGRIIKATDATVITVAHPNRAGDERGSLAFRQADDVRMTVVPKNGRRTLVAEKVRNGEEGPVFDYKLKRHELGFNAKGKPITSCTIIKSDPTQISSDRAAVDRPTSGHVALTTAFTELERDRKTETGILPIAHVAGWRASAEDVRLGFMKLYPVKDETDTIRAGNSRRAAWRLVKSKLPPGFELWKTSPPCGAPKCRSIWPKTREV